MVDWFFFLVCISCVLRIDPAALPDSIDSRRIRPSFHSLVCLRFAFQLGLLSLGTVVTNLTLLGQVVDPSVK